MAVFAVEFSYGLASPFMELLVGKIERNNEKAWGQAARERESGKKASKSERYKKQRAASCQLTADAGGNIKDLKCKRRSVPREYYSGAWR